MIILGVLDLKIDFKEIQKKDYKKAIRFAVKGMHFDWYLDNKILLNLYGRYFWYLELNRATQVIAAYVGDRMVGILLADMKGEEKKYRSLGRFLYVKIFDFLQKKLYKDGAGLYEETTKQMLKEYLKQNKPDGEIIFLATDPKAKMRGIGSMMLLELEKREPGKTVYLYTDDACAYQFYEKRGFDRVCETEIELDMKTKKVPLKCFVYSKKLFEG